MKNRESIPAGQDVQRAALEGNVRIPQHFFAIKIFAGDRVLHHENLEEALRSLVSPVPIDDALIERTRKANMRHELAGVSRIVEPEKVRNVQINGNIHTLKLIERVIGVEGTRPGLSSDLKSSSEIGEWAEAAGEERVQGILEAWQALSKEDQSFIQSLFHATVRILRSPEGKAFSSEYKKHFGGDYVLPETQDEIDRSPERLALKAFTKEIREKLYKEFDTELSEQQKRIFFRFINFIELS